jgi:hypothetical protein
MRRSASASILACLSLIASKAHSTCGTHFLDLKDGPSRTRAIQKFSGAIVFTSGLRVNTDGAANSYHPIGTSKGALNTICNGIAVTPSSGPWAGQRVSGKVQTAGKSASQIKKESADRCQTILDIFRASYNAGYAIPSAGTIDWFAIAHLPPMDGKYRPCLQETGIFKGFFVAQTSRPADPIKDECDPAHWISSTEIPYITLPGNRLAPHGVSPGDLALVHRRVEGKDRILVAVAADTGNPDELGEGSIALHLSLGNPAKTRLPGNISDGVTTILFPGFKAKFPINASSLEVIREELITRMGGQSNVLRCTE